MALPTDPPKPAGANASAFASGRLTKLTVEEAERLAATFRPSWEIDETPFAPSGSFAEADFRAPRSGTQADVRGAVHALNGTHAPAPATVLQDEPSLSVIIDGSLAADVAAAGRSDTPAVRLAPGAAEGQIPQQRTVVMASQRTLVMPNAPRFSGAAARRSTPSMGRGETTVARRSNEGARRSNVGLWIALGAGGLVLLGVGVWLASTSATRPPATPVPASEASTVTAERRIPPAPPAEPIAAQPTQPIQAAASTTPVLPAPPPPTPVAAPAPAPQPTAVLATASPPAAPPARVVVAPTPRAPVWTPPPPPAAKPVPPKPKSGQTIVRDVPF